MARPHRAVSGIQNWLAVWCLNPCMGSAGEGNMGMRGLHRPCLCGPGQSVATSACDGGACFVCTGRDVSAACLHQVLLLKRPSV